MSLVSGRCTKFDVRRGLGRGQRAGAGWDITEIPTDEGKLYLATVLDLFSRKLLACPTSTHPDAELACDAIKIATTMRGGRAKVDDVVFHTDRGSTYTATCFTDLCARIGVRQSMGRVGSCFDNAAAEAFFSTLEHEVLSRHHFTTPDQARKIIVAWCQASTTPAVGTVPPGSKHPTNTKRSPQNSRPRHDTGETQSQLGIRRRTAKAPSSRR